MADDANFDDLNINPTPRPEMYEITSMIVKLAKRWTRGLDAEATRIVAENLGKDYKAGNAVWLEGEAKVARMKFGQRRPEDN